MEDVPAVAVPLGNKMVLGCMTPVWLQDGRTGPGDLVLYCRAERLSKCAEGYHQHVPDRFDRAAMPIPFFIRMGNMGGPIRSMAAYFPTGGCEAGVVDPTNRDRMIYPISMG